jgi:ectoine hydroxylase-related dioxygenase (phytanoyl-CoA dioxygenase family)
MDVAALIDTLEYQGYAVVPQFLPAQRVAELKHAFNTEVPITEMRAIGTDTGKTWRAHNLLAKTRAADDIYLDPRLRTLVQNFLQDRTQINITTLFNTLPGETRQLLHQDDGLWPIPRPHPHFLCNALIALDEFDEANGATHIVPHSHQWHDRAVDQAVQTLQVCMNSGDMLLWAGALWHAGGANTSNRERMGLFISHGVSYLRPQEPQTLSVPQAVARQLPEKLQRLLGYHRFGLGVDGRDPVDVLNDGNVVNPDARPASFWRSKYADEARQVD